MGEIIRVIVTEDLDILREHFCSMVQGQSDMTLVGQASSGKQAVRLADEVGADVILMDIEMDMKHDGIYAAKKILEKHHGIRIVFLTIHEDDETVFNAFETGAVDYVLKSSSNSEIINSIRLAYHGKSPIRPKIAHKIRNEFSRIRRNESSMLQVMAIISQLTHSEREILALLVQGLKLSDVAKTRYVEEVTIKSQINNILKKFDKKRSKEIVKLIKELNLTHIFTSGSI